MMNGHQRSTAPATDKRGCPGLNCQDGDCRQSHKAGSKTLNYRARRITATWHEPHLIEISYQGHSAYIGVSRHGSNQLPYFYTMAEPEESSNQPVEIPASNLMDAIDNCYTGLVNLRHGQPPPSEFDQEKAAQVLRDWYDAI